MWTKYVTRRLAVQVAQAWNFGFGEAMKETYGVSVDDTLVFRDEKKTEYYVDKKEFEAYTAGLYTLLEQPEFIESFHGDARKTLEEIFETVRSACVEDLSTLSNERLLAVYKNIILPNQARFYVRMWTVFNIGEPLANVVSKKLREYVDDKKADEFLLALSSPLVPNDVLEERISLLRIALDGGDKPDDARLAEHCERFRHIPMFDFDHEPYTIDHFRAELLAVEDPREELAKLERQFAERKDDFDRALQQLQPDAAFEELLLFLKENVFLRDHRDMVRQKLNLSLRKLYAEIARRFCVSIAQIAILTNDEIIRCLESGAPFPADELVRREQAFVLIQRGDVAEIYSGDAALVKASSAFPASSPPRTRRASSKTATWSKWMRMRGWCGRSRKAGQIDISPRTIRPLACLVGMVHCSP